MIGIHFLDNSTSLHLSFPPWSAEPETQDMEEVKLERFAPTPCIPNASLHQWMPQRSYPGGQGSGRSFEEGRSRYRAGRWHVGQRKAMRRMQGRMGAEAVPEVLNRFCQPGLIVLDRQHIVCAALDDGAGDGRLCAHGIDGYHTASQRKSDQQLRDRLDLVGFFFCGHAPALLRSRPQKPTPDAAP